MVAETQESSSTPELTVLPLPDAVYLYPSRIRLMSDDAAFAEVVGSADDRVTGPVYRTRCGVNDPMIERFKKDATTVELVYDSPQRTAFPSDPEPIVQRYTALLMPLTPVEGADICGLYAGHGLGDDVRYVDGPLGQLEDPAELLALVRAVAEREITPDVETLLNERASDVGLSIGTGQMNRLKKTFTEGELRSGGFTSVIGGGFAGGLCYCPDVRPGKGYRTPCLCLWQEKR